MVYVIAILIGTFHFATCVSMYLFSQDRITHSFAMHSIRCIILLWWCWVLCCRGQSQFFASPMMVSLSSLLQRITWISLVSIYAAILQFWCRTTITDWRNLLFNYVTVERVLREDIFFIVAPLSVENDPLTRAILEMGKETYKEHHGAPADDDGDLC